MKSEETLTLHLRRQELRRDAHGSHEEGTRLVIEYIEKFWCPTFSSEDLLHP